MLSDYDKLLVTGRNPIREKQGQVRKPVGRDLIVKMGAKRILVADTGEEFRRSFIETVASEPDIQVLGETGDGQELVQMVKEMAPDLVVMEIVLAQMDGIEVLEELGKQERLLFSRLQTNQSVLERYKNGAQKLRDTEQSYLRLKELSDTANGELNGRAKSSSCAAERPSSDSTTFWAWANGISHGFWCSRP